VVHLGMPVDPGNLLLLAEVSGKPVIGLPGCARSPKINGFDFVLQRLLADVPVTPRDIARMGAGGLLKEIPTRPQPRESVPEAPRQPRIAALVLAAGRSTRMGANKLLADVGGKPMVRHAVEAALASQAEAVVVVTGHEAARVRAALAGLDVRFAQNDLYADGLSTSVRAGVAAAEGADGALVCLGDMPGLTARTIDRLIAAFNPAEGRGVIVPVHDGRRGNPVLWGRAFFADLMALSGDVGAKPLLAGAADAVCEVEIGDDGVLTDLDTPDALDAWRARA